MRGRERRPWQWPPYPRQDRSTQPVPLLYEVTRAARGSAPTQCSAQALVSPDLQHQSLPLPLPLPLIEALFPPFPLREVGGHLTCR